jgi:hypothetical protein
MNSTRYLHSVLASDVARWLAVGWIVVGHDRKPSVEEPIVLICWRGKAPVWP